VTPTIRHVISEARDTLRAAGHEEADLEADLLIGHVLGCDRSHLYASLDTPFPALRRRRLERHLQRRVARQPLAYILGNREFFGLAFKVGPGVLVPRPETETLAEEALRIATSPPGPLSATERRERSGPLTIADVGTGCGAIAVSLAVHLPTATVYATDTSRRALAIARANAEAHGVQERIRFLQGSLLTPLKGFAPKVLLGLAPWPPRLRRGEGIVSGGHPQPPGGNSRSLHLPDFWNNTPLEEGVDIIAANLPYLPTARIPTLQPEVSRYEPRRALDGGPDGLRLVRRLLGQAPGYLNETGAILLELDPEQMEAATACALAAFPRARVRRVADLAGRERVLVVECEAL